MLKSIKILGTPPRIAINAKSTVFIINCVLLSESDEISEHYNRKKEQDNNWKRFLNTILSCIQKMLRFIGKALSEDVCHIKLQAETKGWWKKMDAIAVIGIIIVAAAMIYATYDSHFESKEKKG